MKHLLIALLLIPTILLGQTRVFRPDNQIYVEANAGIGVSGGSPIIPAFSTKDWKISNLPFTSLCIGYTSDVGDYSLIDISIGGSFPDIWTAKFGLGSYYDMGGHANASIILGIRLNPGMIYAQYHIKIKQLGFFTFCTEMGTGYWGRGEYIHALNIGWKWPLIGWDKKKKSEFTKH
jgi:hypothetical protein